MRSGVFFYFFFVLEFTIKVKVSLNHTYHKWPNQDTQLQVVLSTNPPFNHFLLHFFFIQPTKKKCLTHIWYHTVFSKHTSLIQNRFFFHVCKQISFYLWICWHNTIRESGINKWWILTIKLYKFMTDKWVFIIFFYQDKTYIISYTKFHRKITFYFLFAHEI